MSTDSVMITVYVTKKMSITYKKIYVMSLQNTNLLLCE